MPSPETFAVALGLAMIVVAAGWRASERRRSADRLHRALRDRDPELRAAAVRAIGSGGLARHAKALLEALRLERDQRVLDAMQDAVMRNLWEPTDTETLVSLRLWAHQRAGTAVAEPTVQAPVAQAEPVAQPEPEVHDTQRPSSRAAAARPTIAPVESEAPAAIPMPAAAAPTPMPATTGDRPERPVVDARARLLVRRAEEIIGQEVHSLVVTRDGTTVSYEQFRAAS